MRLNDYKIKADSYAQHNKNEGTLLLAYRVFGSLFDKYITSDGTKALDIGSGVGRSRKYLEEIGFNADGVDIDEDMVRKAKEIDQLSHERYQLITDLVVPHRNSKYDLAFSSLVVLEMGSKTEIFKHFSEAYRTIKFDGTFIVLTVNDDFYKFQWLSVDTNYDGNREAQSGDKVKIKIREVNLELDDFYWTKNDYRQIAKEAGFSILEEVEPKASADDTTPWISEKEQPPFVIFVMKKTVSLKSKEEIAFNSRLNIHLPGRGFFAETFKSQSIVKKSDLPCGYTGDRNLFSTVEILISPGEFWPFHKLKSSETFQHIDGNDLKIHCIDNFGNYNLIFLGSEHDDAVKEFTVPHDVWYAEETAGRGGYTLFQAKTSPAFHPDDLEEMNIDKLARTNNQDKRIMDLIDRFYPGSTLKKTESNAEASLTSLGKMAL